MVGDLVPLPVAQASAATATVADSAAAGVATTDAAPSASADSPRHDGCAGERRPTRSSTAAPATSDDVAPMAAAATDTVRGRRSRVGDARGDSLDRGGDGRASKPIGSSRNASLTYDGRRRRFVVPHRRGRRRVAERR